MKKHLLALGCVLALAFSLIGCGGGGGGGPAGPSWEIRVVDDGGDYIGDSNAIALDGEDNPHISYFAYGSELSGLKYAYWDGSGWHLELLDDSGGNAGTSIAVDSDNHPHISYFASQSSAPHELLKYACHDGDQWWFETVHDYDYGLKYAYYDGNAWNREQVAEGNVGRINSIALDSYGGVHICYYDSGSRQVKHAAKTGNSWTIITVDGSSGDLSLTADQDGNLYLSYNDAQGYLKCASWDGDSWQTWTVGGAGRIRCNAIAVDQFGKPHICYLTDEYNERVLKYARMK